MDLNVELQRVPDLNGFVPLMTNFLPILENLHGHRGRFCIPPLVLASHVKPPPHPGDQFGVWLQHNGVKVLLLPLCRGQGHRVT